MCECPECCPPCGASGPKPTGPNGQHEAPACLQQCDQWREVLVDVELIQHDNVDEFLSFVERLADTQIKKAVVSNFFHNYICAQLLHTEGLFVLCSGKHNFRC